VRFTVARQSYRHSPPCACALQICARRFDSADRYSSGTAWTGYHHHHPSSSTRCVCDVAFSHSTMIDAGPAVRLADARRPDWRCGKVEGLSALFSPRNQLPSRTLFSYIPVMECQTGLEISISGERGQLTSKTWSKKRRHPAAQTVLACGMDAAYSCVEPRSWRHAQTIKYSRSTACRKHHPACLRSSYCQSLFTIKKSGTTHKDVCNCVSYHERCEKNDFESQLQTTASNRSKRLS